mmetsp:Transcript_77192/g.216680  ORF Transcript_77192/g.216680 Transcript_77192/m.216680 type:complete len:273 (-) Transcript_77192:1522-2340(-)
MCQSPVGSVAIQPSLQGSTIQDEFAPLGYEDLPPPVGRPHILDFSHSSSLFLCLSAICRALAHMVQQCALQRHGYRNVLAAQRTSARSVALLESTPQGEARGLRHPQNFNHGERHARSTGLLVVLLFARTRSTCSTGASAACLFDGSLGRRPGGTAAGSTPSVDASATAAASPTTAAARSTGRSCTTGIWRQHRELPPDPRHRWCHRRGPSHRTCRRWCAGSRTGWLHAHSGALSVQRQPMAHQGPDHREVRHPEIHERPWRGAALQGGYQG